MKESVIVVPYDANWPSQFQEIAGRLRQSLGDRALRIDHIGSTAVPGLDAKPVIDIQISVPALEPMIYAPAIESTGYVYRADNPDRTKRYFREKEGQPRTHIHVRESGSWSERTALLFRDFLREHESYRNLYASEKHALAQRYSRPDQRHLYVDGKDPIVWRILYAASKWSQTAGWRPGKRDC
ncbi:GrpB family protein [Saccharibacillus deserti]|uniref:GrpB family protein n=1 Tax=Saccharibacillus deserti TaxID=1634444 RepID=UPI001554A935